MITEVKNLRVHIDGLYRLVKELPPSAETTKACNSLILGKAWLGKVLGKLGTESPYPKDGNRHTVADIEKTADVDTKQKLEGNQIEKIDWLRQRIGEVNKETEDYARMGNETAISFWRTEQHLAEARFWLGFELQRIKEQ